MFTGLIMEKGKIVRANPSGGGLRLVVSAPMISKTVKIGDSVAVNGTCLTAVTVTPPMLEFDAVMETVERTTLPCLQPGTTVNLEPALRVGDQFGGHMVLGHVDGTGVLRGITKHGSETLLRFAAPPEIMMFIVEKGSVAIDGISVTIADLTEDSFSVAVIPHTLANTTLGEKHVGNTVNLETDIIGKYVLKYIGKTAATSDSSLFSKLAEGGFLD